MKPKPVVVETICSECGLDWEPHGENPTTSDCIRLLKAELAKPRSVTIAPYVQPWPYPVYPLYPSIPYRPYGWQMSGGTYSTIQCQGYNNSTTFKTPAIEATCSAVSNG